MHTLIKHTVVDAYVEKPFAIHTYIVICAHNHAYTNACSSNNSFQNNNMIGHQGVSTVVSV